MMTAAETAALREPERLGTPHPGKQPLRRSAIGRAMKLRIRTVALIAVGPIMIRPPSLEAHAEASGP